MPERILVINPNSNEAVTRAIDDAVMPLRIPGGPKIHCLPLEEGPPGVESQRDADGVIMPLCRVIREADTDAAAFAIACFSDPRLFAAQETTAKPVLGIAECGILTPGHRFGMISILVRSVPRHLRYIAAMGVGQRLAGDLPIGLGVTELADTRTTLTRMIDVGRLRDQHGADVEVIDGHRATPALEGVAECWLALGRRDGLVEIVGCRCSPALSVNGAGSWAREQKGYLACCIVGALAQCTDDNQKRAKQDRRDKSSEWSRFCGIGALSSPSKREGSYSGFALRQWLQPAIGRDNFRFGSWFPALRCLLVRHDTLLCLYPTAGISWAFSYGQSVCEARRAPSARVRNLARRGRRGRGRRSRNRCRR
jgi:allantoin racemase